MVEKSALIEQIDALLALDATGKLVPHGIGGLARELLTTCRDELAFAPSSPTMNAPRTRVRQTSYDWRVDRLVLGFIWLPMGRWIHQDWWCPYQFQSVADALTFQAALGEPHA
jgi:hypothetical protein